MFIKDSISSKILTKRKFPPDIDTWQWIKPFWRQRQNFK